MIYHILTSAEWAQASAHPSYAPDGFAADGYIHCCSAEQLQYVGDHYFRGKQDLVILCIETSKLNAPVKYEDLNREGMLFPHLYGALKYRRRREGRSFPAKRGWHVSDSSGDYDLEQEQDYAASSGSVHWTVDLSQDYGHGPTR